MTLHTRPRAGGKSLLALAAAAAMSAIGGTPLAMTDANHAAAFNRPRASYYEGQRQRHPTKKGPGRGGHKGKLGPRYGRKYAYIAGQRRNLKKPLGTRG